MGEQTGSGPGDWSGLGSFEVKPEENKGPDPVVPTPQEETSGRVLWTTIISASKSLEACATQLEANAGLLEVLQADSSSVNSLAAGVNGWPRGHDIDHLVAQKGVAGLRTIFGNRRHNAVLKRANSIIRFIHWYTKTAFSVTPFPLQACDVEGYLEFLQEQSASPSALSSFIEAVNFCDKVLNIETVGTVITPKAMILSEIANARRKEKRQARVLSVREVCSLESFLADERNLVVDRFAAGCFLFALFSRSRWSDLRCVYGHVADIPEVEGKITGYLEYKTRSHKTARLVKKQGLSMPLVAPVWGVGKTPWVLEFVKVAKLADRPLDTLHKVPLLPAPTEDGGRTNRSTSTQEAKKWLLSVLSRALGKDPEMTTIHCLKSIALS